ncbi:MAG: hypothetical protein HY820_42595 [Acidobacteria bacterium]|nr:hypothetical protein [Acidobacteriota bacterium]
MLRVAALALALAASVQAQGVVGWGADSYGQATPPTRLGLATAIGRRALYHSLAGLSLDQLHARSPAAA